MKIIIIGTATEAIEDIDSVDADAVVITTTANLPLVKNCSALVTLYALPDTIKDEDDMDVVSHFEVATDPEEMAVGTATDEDLVFMAWDDSPRHHGFLKALQGRGVQVFDMSDGFQQLVMAEYPDVDELVKRITADVLKTVRAEIAESLRTRRYRTATPKV